MGSWLLCLYSVLAFQWSEGAVDTRDKMAAGPNRRLDDEHSVPAGESLPDPLFLDSSSELATRPPQGNLLVLMPPDAVCGVLRCLDLKSAGYLRLDFRLDFNHAGAAWRSGGLLTPLQASWARV